MTMHKLKQMTVLLGGLGLLLAGCASLREKVEFKMSAEQEQLEPHELRREELRRMARPE
jgi:starvation-inducible outer membrane lipoprotein